MITRTIVFSLAASSAIALGEWPQFLGPERDGTTSEAIVAEYPTGEPEIAWTQEVGSGFAGPAVADGVVYLFHRQEGKAVLQTYEAETGKPGWAFRYATDYRDNFGFDDGPRAIPLVAGGRVFLFGAEGMAHAIDATTGKQLWSLDLRKEFAADKGFFGRAPSPLLVGETLVLQVGGEVAGIIGLDPAKGAVRWMATKHEAGYASPIAAEIGGRSVSLHFTRNGFVCLDPKDGTVLIEKAHRAEMHASVNAASPLLLGPDRVFLSACYDVGAALWQLDLAKGSVTPVWAAGGKLDAHYATPVPFDGHLIGFHGRQETGTVLRCIEAASGKIAWTSERLPAGSVTLAGETLLVLTERGELILAEADSTKFEPAARGQILGNGTRAYPALSGGRLFARDKRRLVCVKLKTS